MNSENANPVAVQGEVPAGQAIVVARNDPVDRSNAENTEVYRPPSAANSSISALDFFDQGTFATKKDLDMLHEKNCRRIDEAIQKLSQEFFTNIKELYKRLAISFENSLADHHARLEDRVQFLGEELYATLNQVASRQSKVPVESKCDQSTQTVDEEDAMLAKPPEVLNSNDESGFQMDLCELSRVNIDIDDEKTIEIEETSYQNSPVHSVSVLELGEEPVHELIPKRVLETPQVPAGAPVQEQVLEPIQEPPQQPAEEKKSPVVKRRGRPPKRQSTLTASSLQKKENVRAVSSKRKSKAEPEAKRRRESDHTEMHVQEPAQEPVLEPPQEPIADCSKEPNCTVQDNSTTSLEYMQQQLKGIKDWIEENRFVDGKFNCDQEMVRAMNKFIELKKAIEEAEMEMQLDKKKRRSRTPTVKNNNINNNVTDNNNNN